MVYGRDTLIYIQEMTKFSPWVSMIRKKTGSLLKFAGLYFQPFTYIDKMTFKIHLTVATNIL